MTTVPLFDCDNHIYEPPDAVTRYLAEGSLNPAITPSPSRTVSKGCCAAAAAVTGLDHPIDMAHRPGQA